MVLPIFYSMLNTRFRLTIFFCVVVLFFITPNLYAQSLEEYKKQEKNRLQLFAEQQRQEMEKLRKEYTAYVAKRDLEWSDYLKKEWKNHQTFTAEPIPQKPKPLTIPEYKPQTVVPKPDNTRIPASDSIVIPTESVPAPVEPIRKPAEDGKESRSLQVLFYGRTFGFLLDPALMELSVQTVDKVAICQFWDKASACNYTPIVESLMKAKTELNINDFGYLMLVRKFAETVYTDNANASRLLTWFLLIRSGYSVRVGYVGNEIALLVPTPDQIYEKSYLTLENVRYYVFPSLSSPSFFTYDQDYIQGRLFDLDMGTPLNLEGKRVSRTCAFDFNQKSYSINVECDSNLIDFYNDYPISAFEIYFDAAASVPFQESMPTSLKPLMEGMDELEAAGFLLHFVQTAFAYKTDPEQFGREKYFFPDEVLYYPYCDCEDRSVLYAYLVRQLLGLKVVGLEYSGHMATAVALHAKITGDYLVFGNDTYVVADPTYINAPIGMSMPDYKSVAPIIHLIKGGSTDEKRLGKIWDLIAATGCYKGSNRNHSLTLPDGQMVLAGYYSGQTQFGSVLLSGRSDARNCFIGKLDHSGNVLWAKSLVSSKDAVGMSVVADPSGNLLVAGVFTGSLTVGKTSLNAVSGKSDLFLACFSPVGNLLWLNQGNLASLPSDPILAFSVLFGPNGSLIETKSAGQQLDDQAQGLFVRSDGNVLYSGMITNTLAVVEGDRPASYASASNLDPLTFLDAESVRLISQQADPSMAGLLAAIRLVKDMGISLTGAQAQAALTRKNPAFKNTCPNIYRNLGMISFVKNSKGIITILTQNGKDVSFDKIRISHNSTISVSEMPGSNYQINVLSGIKVGKMVVWFDLNYIRMFALKGDLLFDYSKDHSKTTVNIKKDILD
jgi:hypothetical protein